MGREESSRGYWSSRWDYLFSLAGYSVGVGNVWRFPYLCYKHGGGAFLIPYVVMVLLLGVPLFLLESALGQFSSSGCITVFAAVPIFKGAGYAMLLVGIIASFYYTMIVAYPLVYLVYSMNRKLPWTTCDNYWNTPKCSMLKNTTLEEPTTHSVSPADEFFHNKVLGISDGIGEGKIMWSLVLASLVVWVIVFLAIFKGVKVVGKVVWVTALFPYVMLLVLFFRGVTLPGASSGILYYVVPNFSLLQSPSVWTSAALQVFFSLGPGWGTLLTMGSFSRFHHLTTRDAFIIPVINALTSFFAGFVVFSVLGFLAHQMNVPVAEVTASGPALAFIMYPEALALMPLAPLWAILFFLMMFFLGIDSVFVQTEAMVVSIVDAWPAFRPRQELVTLVLCVTIFLGSLSLCASNGMYVLVILDQYCVVFTITLTTLSTIIAFAHVYGVGRVFRDLEMMMQRPLSFFFYLTWTYATPIILLITFISNIITIGGEKLQYGDYVFPDWAIGLGWATALFSALAIPIYSIIYLILAKGTFSKRCRMAVTPAPEWGPALETDRAEWEEYCRTHPLPHRYYHPNADCSRVKRPRPTQPGEEMPMNVPEFV